MLIAHIDDEVTILEATKNLIQVFRTELANARELAAAEHADQTSDGVSSEDSVEPQSGDDPDDPELVLQRWVQHGLARNIEPEDLDFEVASTAKGFWKNIKKRRKKNLSLPNLILLDLKLDGTDEQSGLKVLDMVKSSPDLKQVPVIMLTTHTDSALVKLSYERGANGYVGKGGFGEFDGRFFELITHWVGTNKLPT